MNKDIPFNKYGIEIDDSEDSDDDSDVIFNPDTTEPQIKKLDIDLIDALIKKRIQEEFDKRRDDKDKDDDIVYPPPPPPTREQLAVQLFGPNCLDDEKKQEQQKQAPPPPPAKKQKADDQDVIYLGQRKPRQPSFNNFNRRKRPFCHHYPKYVFERPSFLSLVFKKD